MVACRVTLPSSTLCCLTLCCCLTPCHGGCVSVGLQVELLTELASIAKRLAGDDWGLAAMVQCDMQQVLITLLHSTGAAAAGMQV